MYIKAISFFITLKFFAGSTKVFRTRLRTFIRPAILSHKTTWQGSLSKSPLCPAGTFPLVIVTVGFYTLELLLPVKNSYISSTISWRTVFKCPFTILVRLWQRPWPSPGSFLLLSASFAPFSISRLFLSTPPLLFSWRRPCPPPLHAPSPSMRLCLAFRQTTLAFFYIIWLACLLLKTQVPPTLLCHARSPSSSSSGMPTRTSRQLIFVLFSSL